MRMAQADDNELRELLKAEIARFKELDAQKKALWEGEIETDNAIQEYEQVKRAWQDSAEEIKHLHRKLYPYFPRGGTCGNCGCDMLPVFGSQKGMSQCIACGEQRVEWGL